MIVRFIGDADHLTGTVGKVEGRMSGLKSKLLALGVGAAIFTGAKSAIQAGVDLNETTNKLGLAFGENAADIQAWAKGSAKSMGLPKQAAEENAAGFGLLFSKLGLTGDASAKMSKSMVQLAVDLGSVHNADPTEILEAQSAAFRGEFDSLQKFVPAINAAAVQTEALKETGKKNASELTNQEKATATYRIMLAQTKVEQGDFARTSDQAANKSKINAARVKDLSANIGLALLPAVTTATNLLGSLANWMERNKTAAVVLGSVVLGLTGFVLAMSAATKVSTAVQAAARGATIAWTVAQKALNLAMRMNMIGLIVTGLILLIGWIVITYKRSETFRNIVQGAFRAVQAAAGDLVGSVVKGFRFLLGVWLNAAGGILHGAAVAFGWVPGIGGKLRSADAAFNRFKNSVLDKLRSIANAAFGWGERLGRSYAGGLTRSQAIVAQAAGSLANIVKTHMRTGSPAEAGPLHDNPPDVMGAGVALNFAKGLRQGADAVRGAASFLAGNALPRNLPAAGVGSGGMHLTINVQTSADAAEIAREVAWQARFSGR